jgi:hypothetical protein
MKRGLGTSRPKANLGEAHAAGTEAEVSLWWCPNVNPKQAPPGPGAGANALPEFTKGW